MSDPADAGLSDAAWVEGEDEPTAAQAKRVRRAVSSGVRRVLFILGGLILLVGSVLGFYMTADAFDERLPVTVAARDIAAGETLTASDLTFDLLVAGRVPHLPWTSSSSAVFEGLVAVQDIAAGAVMLPEMVVDGTSIPVGAELEVVVPLDLSLATEGVQERDLVLLVDPGAAPDENGPGRPRAAVREFELTNFDGSQMRLFLPPEEWAEWERLLEDVGGTLMVVPIGLGGDPQETTERLNTVWDEQWAEEVAELLLAVASLIRTAGPGELEVVVSFDTSLVPTEIGADEFVLLVDPGLDPAGNDPGRARSVIDTLQLEGFENGQMTMFVGPERWNYWRSLPGELGADPMVLPVAEGTDIDDMIDRLNSTWQASWEAKIADALGPVS